MEIILEGIKIAINISNSKVFRRYESTMELYRVVGYSNLKVTIIRDAPLDTCHLLKHKVGLVKMRPRSDPDAVMDPLDTCGCLYDRRENG